MRDDAPTTSASAVSCRGVIKYYGKTAARTQALQGADLDVGFGEMTVERLPLHRLRAAWAVHAACLASS